MTTRQSDPEFEEAVLQAFAFLSPQTLPKIVRSEYDENAFGNAVVELETEKLRVRVVRDRSSIEVDLAPLGYGDWFDEEVVLQSVGATVEAKSLNDSMQRGLKGSARAIAPNIDAIVRSFEKENWNATRADLLARRERRGEEFRQRLIDLATRNRG
jgi:hypothetical protein